MTELEFEQRLNDAFIEHMPIADKVRQLRQELCGDLSFNTLVQDSIERGLITEDIDVEQFYRQFLLHYEVAMSSEYDDIATDPIENNQLWQDSVVWLTVHLLQMEVCRETDERFDKFGGLQILWWFKWVIPAMVDDPSVDKAKMNAYLHLLGYYCTEVFELGERSLYKMAVMQGIKIADRSVVEKCLFAWLEAEENFFDDCWACQLDDIVRAYVFLGEHDKALMWAKEILDGTTSCGEVPHVTNSLIAQAYFYTNQIDKAQKFLDKGYKLVRGKGEFMRPIAEFMRVAILLGEMDKAVQIYQESKGLFEECESLFDQMLFAIEASKLPIAEKSALLTQARKLARAFDARNGNDYYTACLPTLYT